MIPHGSIELDGDWPHGDVLRCPQCGNRRGFWMRGWVSMDANGEPHTLIGTHGSADDAVECNDCCRLAPYRDYLPPWPARPDPARPGPPALSRAEREIEAAWAVREATLWDGPTGPSPDDAASNPPASRGGQ